MAIYTIDDCIIKDLQAILSRSGNITPVSNYLEIPFAIKRIFYIYDIPGGKDRGAHAHKTCHQFLVAASGAFEVALDDGNIIKNVVLNRPFIGLHIPPGIWAHELNFSSGAICLVLTSEFFDANDYIRDYNQYLNFKKNELV